MNRRVCLLSHNPVWGGGVASMAAALGRELRRRGYEPHLFFPSKSLSDALRLPRNHLRLHGMDATHLRSVPYLHVLNYLVPALTAGATFDGFDVFQAAGGINLCALPFALRRKRFVCWSATPLRDEWEARYRCTDFTVTNLPSQLNVPSLPLMYRLERMIFQRAAKVLAISRYTAEAIRRQHGLNERHVWVAPYPMDTETFRPAPDASGRILDEPFILLVARVDDRRKNAPLLLRAFREVKRRAPRLKLVIVGNRPKTRSLLQLCGALGIADDVIFTGRLPLEKMLRFYQQAELFALPSRQEGLGLALLEAMACGVPVVATRSGGPEEIVRDGETGVLVPNNDEVAFTTAMLRLIKDADLRRQMGEAARRHVIENFSPDVVMPRFLEAYRQVYGSMVNG